MTIVLAAALAAAVQALPSPDAQQLVCRSYVPIGTRFPERVCRPAAHWKIIDRAVRTRSQPEFNPLPQIPDRH